MSTLAKITDRIIATLQGFSRDQDEQTYLTTSISDVDLTFTVNEPKLISQGLIEVGDELMWVTRVDNTTGTVTVAPFGRGYQLSSAATHDENCPVSNNPKFPRSFIVSTVNDAINGVYPDLYVRATTTFPFSAARVTYEMPATAEQIHKISWQDIGPSKRWVPISRYRFDPAADTDEFASGKSVDLYQSAVPGRTVKVVYQQAPSLFSDPAQEFTTTTGLSATAEDCVVYGALFRLVGMLESPRLQLTAVESQLRAQLIQPGSTKASAQHFMQLYQLALISERERLMRSDPISAHFRYI